MGLSIKHGPGSIISSYSPLFLIFVSDTLAMESLNNSVTGHPLFEQWGMLVNAGTEHRIVVFEGESSFQYQILIGHDGF